MARKQYPIYIRIGSSCFGAIAIFVLVIAAICAYFFIVDG